MIRTSVLALSLTACAPLAEPVATPFDLGVHDDLHALEEASGGRLGVILLDDSGREMISFRADQRFAFCSAFKLALAGAALDRAATGQLDLDSPVTYSRGDFPGYQPALEARLNGDTGQISLRDALDATVTVSDNAAANLLIDALGGPAAVTAIWRGWGDTVTRLDRRETELNENRPGDGRDTATPVALADTARRLLTTDLLSPTDEARLERLTNEASTGLTRVRGGLPETWRAGDKTGTCKNDGSPDPQANDIGWFVTDTGQRYWFAVMLGRYDGTNADASAIHRDVGRLFAQAVSR